MRQFGGGLEVAQKLARANIITNKNLIPSDLPKDWDRPGGLRMGTIEVTRLGMRESQMETIADFMARILIERQSPEDVAEDVIEFRLPYQKFYYCFDHGLPGVDRLPARVMLFGPADETVEANHFAIIRDGRASVAPEHLVHFAGNHEQIRLRHPLDEGRELQLQAAIRRRHPPRLLKVARVFFMMVAPVSMKR